jgi:hypothetical protein
MDVEIILDFSSYTTSTLQSTESLFAKKLAYITSIIPAFFKSQIVSPWIKVVFMELKIYRASTNLKKVNLHLYISLRKRYTYKTGIFVRRN